MSDLLERFLTQECTAHVRHLLEDATADSASLRPRFEFNLFEITIDLEEDIAMLEDVLDDGKASFLRVPLAEFTAALKRASA